MLCFAVLCEACFALLCCEACFAVLCLCCALFPSVLRTGIPPARESSPPELAPVPKNPAVVILLPARSAMASRTLPLTPLQCVLVVNNAFRSHMRLFGSGGGLSAVSGAVSGGGVVGVVGAAGAVGSSHLLLDRGLAVRPFTSGKKSASASASSTFVQSTSFASLPLSRSTSSRDNVASFSTNSHDHSNLHQPDQPDNSPDVHWDFTEANYDKVAEIVARYDYALATVV